MALIVGAIVNMTSTLPAQADHGKPVLAVFSIGTDGTSENQRDLLSDNGSVAHTQVTDPCGEADYGCSITFDTDVKQVVLRAIPGDPASDPSNGANESHSQDTTNYYALMGGLDIPAGDGQGVTLPLAEGSSENVFQVKVVQKKDPSVFSTYTVTVTRTPNTSPYFAADAVNDRFVYGYAEDVMQFKGGDRQGAGSYWNHPSDDNAFSSTVDDNNAFTTDSRYYRKDQANKRFIKDTVSNYTSPTDSNPAVADPDATDVIAFKDIIRKGAVTSTGVEATGEARFLKNKDKVNLSGGLMMVAGKNLGTIRLPMASGGNKGIVDYELMQVGSAGNEVTELPDGLAANYVIWTDADEATHDLDKNGDGDKTDEADGKIQSVELVAGAEINNSANAPANTVGIQLSGTPLTESGGNADKSVHAMVYRAVDGDSDNTGSSDAAEISFSVTIQKGLVSISDPGSGTEPDANELSNLVIATTGDNVTPGNSTHIAREDDDAVVTPKKFDSDVTTYRVTIPYEKEEITVTPTEAATGSLIQLISTSGSPTLANNTAHKFPELTTGSNAPIRIKVTPPSTSKLAPKIYTIIVSRDYNDPAQFDTSAKPSDLNFYDQAKIDPVDLPGGRLGNGDQPDLSELSSTSTIADLSGEWRYDLALAHRYTNGRGSPGWPYGTGTEDNATRTQDTSDDTANWLDAGDTGFAFTTYWDAKNKQVKRQLTGTPKLSNTSNARSSYSEYTLLYVAKDGDLDDTSSDNAEHTFKVTVWRNVTLNDLTVDTTPSTTGDAKDVYNLTASTTPAADVVKYSKWNKDRTYEYSYTVDHNIDQVTVAAAPRTDLGLTQDAVAYTSPDDADTETIGHQVDLVDGNNQVVIQVSNGGNVGTHELNIYRRPLGVNPITVTALAGDEDIELTPDFDVATLNYTGEVESHQDVLFIDVSAVTHPNAQVSINYIDTGRSKAKEVNADPGENTYRVDVNLGASQTTYWLRITRKGNVPPSFGSETVASTTKQVGKALVTCNDDGSQDSFLQLPEAETPGNGASVYSIDATTLPDGVSFDPLKRQLKGTPVLREAYERSYEIAYVVSDSDTDTKSEDTDTITFTMTVTNDTVDPCADGAGTTPAPKNELINLVVTYDLPALKKTDVDASLDFDSGTYEYNVELPYGSTNKRIAAYVHSGASVSLNQVRISHGVHTPLRDGANTVRVSYPELSSTNYDLTVTEASQSVPSFSEAVPDQTWQAGKEITAMSLPVATGGNAPLTYSLADHRSQMPSGLSFNAETRVLSGTPSLSNVDSAETAIYMMTYTVVDRDGDPDTDEFRITITTEAVDVANPGSKPMSLNVVRTGTSANLTWNAGDDASSQAVVALQLSDVAGTVKLEPVAANAETHRLTGLQTGNYIFWVVGYDSSGSYKDADGNLYSDIYIEQ